MAPSARPGARFRGVVRLALAAVAAWPAAAADSAATSEPYAVVSYLPEWRYEGANWDTISEHSSHVLLFSLEPDAKGNIIAMDRLPRKELMMQARAAATRHGSKLMICFGGNGRSNGFSPMVRKRKRRERFLERLGRLMEKHSLDGVDYNWEYPGYSFAKGYLSDEEVRWDYKGLSALIRETKEFFASRGSPKEVTMAYYPDGRQEKLLKEYGIDQHVDLMHMMSYDQVGGGGHHSTLEYGLKTAKQGAEILPPLKLTLGVPFYGRHSRTGDWTTYEDLVQQHHPLEPDVNHVPAGPDKGGGEATQNFNGVKWIEEKTAFALRHGLGGVMIWEVGQDCRLAAVTHGDKTHVRTCPEDNSSLLLAITRAAAAAGRAREQSSDVAPGADEL